MTVMRLLLGNIVSEIATGVTQFNELDMDSSVKYSD